MTLYGPGIAFGAPSSGSVVLTRSALGPGAWANETHAVRTNAAVSADFMRRSLAEVAGPSQSSPASACVLACVTLFTHDVKGV